MLYISLPSSLALLRASFQSIIGSVARYNSYPDFEMKLLNGTQHDGNQFGNPLNMTRKEVQNDNTYWRTTKKDGAFGSVLNDISDVLRHVCIRASCHAYMPQSCLPPTRKERCRP